MFKNTNINTLEKMKSTIEGTLDVLFAPDDVVELRAFKTNKTRSGYFDDHNKLAKEAITLDRDGWQVYVTLQKVTPDLLARSANRVKEYPKSTTSDRDILCYRWLPLDFDPVRPSGVSSTKEEKEAAELCAREVKDYLKGKGWPSPLVGDSGNGFHLLYRVELPNDQESKTLIKDTLEALSFMFDDEKVKIDTGVFNAGRIWKLYGTTARKGDSIEERPHRCSKIVHIPKEITA